MDDAVVGTAAGQRGNSHAMIFFKVEDGPIGIGGVFPGDGLAVEVGERGGCVGTNGPEEEVEIVIHRGIARSGAGRVVAEVDELVVIRCATGRGR